MVPCQGQRSSCFRLEVVEPAVAVEIQRAFEEHSLCFEQEALELQRKTRCSVSSTPMNIGTPLRRVNSVSSVRCMTRAMHTGSPLSTPRMLPVWLSVVLTVPS